MFFSIPGLASCSTHQTSFRGRIHRVAARAILLFFFAGPPEFTVFVFHMATVGERDPDENYRIWRRLLTFN